VAQVTRRTGSHHDHRGFWWSLPSLADPCWIMSVSMEARLRPAFACKSRPPGRMAWREPFRHRGSGATGGARSWPVEDRLRGTSDWFATADMLGQELVPAWADWCAVHVRASIVDALRAGSAVSLAELGLRRPVDGEPLEMVTLRHRDAARETVVRQWAAEVPVRTGDAHGAGRVTATGITRYLPHVGPAMLHATAATAQQQAQFRQTRYRQFHCGAAVHLDRRIAGRHDSAPRGRRPGSLHRTRRTSRRKVRPIGGRSA
jgi:hypothetical protein